VRRGRFRRLRIRDVGAGRHQTSKSGRL
jgi:hypothetical protein